MRQEVFDAEQLTAMTRATDLILGYLDKGRPLERKAVAHAVLSVAAENSEFDPPKLARLTRALLGLS